jgi:two-component system, LytTR family, response regulator
MNIRAIILEDEAYGLQNLVNHLKNYCPEVEVVGTAGSIEDGKILLADPELKPDVAFLDISLSDGLVFQLLNLYDRIPFEVIFISSYHKFAVRACRYSSIWFLVKPIDPEELREAVDKLKVIKNYSTKERLEVFKDTMKSSVVSNGVAPGRISLPTNTGYHFVDMKNIIRLESLDNYTHFYIQGTPRITIAKTIKFYEQLLPEETFFRVHKGDIINREHLLKYVKSDHNYVLMSDQAKVVVSKRRKNEFMDWIQGKMVGSSNTEEF